MTNHLPWTTELRGAVQSCSKVYAESMIMGQVQLLNDAVIVDKVVRIQRRCDFVLGQNCILRYSF